MIMACNGVLGGFHLHYSGHFLVSSTNADFLIERVESVKIFDSDLPISVIEGCDQTSLFASYHSAFWKLMRNILMLAIILFLCQHSHLYLIST